MVEWLRREDIVLDEKQEQPRVADDGLPVIPLDDAYFARVAKRLEAILGEPPLWYTATPEELAAAFSQWADDIEAQWEAAGRPVAGIPLEALRRENMYD